MRENIDVWPEAPANLKKRSIFPVSKRRFAPRSSTDLSAVKRPESVGDKKTQSSIPNYSAAVILPSRTNMILPSSETAAFSWSGVPFHTNSTGKPENAMCERVFHQFPGAGAILGLGQRRPRPMQSASPPRRDLVAIEGSSRKKSF